MKFVINFLFALAAVTLFSTAVGQSIDVDPAIVGAVTVTATLFTPQVSGALFAGLNKEIWLPEIMEDFYADDSFLKESRDFTPFVENDKLNLAEAGGNPAVILNNNVYPVPSAERNDTPIAIELEYYDTENTIIRNAELAELSYDKRQSVTYGHKQALKMFFMQRAAFNWSASSNSANTPVLSASGGADENGFEKLTFEDILKLEEAFDEAEVPAEGRVLLLNTLHKRQLREQDLSLFKNIFNKGEGFGGFKFYTLSKKRMPVFNKTTGAKVAFGAAAAPATDTHCSIAWQKDEVCRADGTLDMFADLKNPEARGDIIGFQKRGIALNIRAKGIGAIYSPDA